jgi:hypothetical protein
VCRLLFQPIEESTTTGFALLLPRHTLRTDDNDATSSNTGAVAANMAAADKERPGRMAYAQTSLAAILKLVLLISSILVTFGSNYSQVQHYISILHTTAP